jgi:hypothetical protein
MQPTKKISALLFVIAIALQGCAHDEKKSVSTNQTAKKIEQPVAKSAEPAAAPVIEQPALDRLKQMSDTLTASKAFSYRSHSSIALQAKNGQFVTFFTDAELALQRPNKLHMTVSGDTYNLHLYFDGTKASAFDADNNLYAVSTPLNNIDEMLDYVMTKAQVNFPSADIMYSNPYAHMTQNLTDATVIGESLVNGVLTEHFAYRDPMLDWEIWITKGEKALPMRLAMTYKQVQNRPSFLVEFDDWKLNPKLKAKTFEFKAPADAKQIEFGSYSQQQK